MRSGESHPPERLRVYNGGFLTQKRLRRILHLSGYSVTLGLPREGDRVAIWGNSPTAHRGRAIAERYDAPLLRVEDAFLRSLLPGRSGEPPIGLHLDRTGVHFDGRTPSDLETFLATAPLDDAAQMATARASIARIQDAHLTKYAAVDPAIPAPPPGYVLVVDQTRGDASVTASGADRATFLDMLIRAQEDHPGARVLIKTHPETRLGHRPGYFSPEDETNRVSLCTDAVSPWHLLEGALAVYTVSSQLGFEAILAGHRPHVFGQPFYVGWGLSEDYTPVPRRERQLTRAQLFVGAMMEYPVWYDPYEDQLCDLPRVIDTLEARARAWREDRHGWTASGMRLWKRRPLQQFFGAHGGVNFQDTRGAPPRRNMVWAGKATAEHGDAVRVEDGFLRSRGLGADLIPPLSLVTDDLGIYYDPSRPSRLEAWITQRAKLRPDQQQRAEALINAIVRLRLSKYNLAQDAPDLPPGHKVLVPGQVEDDASIRKGTSTVRTNLDLLRAARTARPNAILIYKPHPDVEAGLRPGAIDANGLADLVADRADPAGLLGQVQEVWTMTSALGFEALLRGVGVTTLGAPFYAGWGLTADLGDVPARRQAQPTLAGLVHATLIDYPRYFDPVTGLPCPVEVAVDRLASGSLPRAGLANRSLAKLQGAFATWAHLWR
ncbi:MAG: capsular polysaccharide biosynthesis protein [Paracoccaceae bacterium]